MTVQRAAAIHKQLSKKTYASLQDYERDLLKEVTQVLRYAKRRRNPGGFVVERSLKSSSNWEFWASATTLLKAKKIAYQLGRSWNTRILYKSGSIVMTNGLARRNPVRIVAVKPVQIYGRVLRMEAQKIGKHRCDSECASTNHCYYHDFKAGAVALGLPDGSVLLKSKTGKRLWGMF